MQIEVIEPNAGDDLHVPRQLNLILRVRRGQICLQVIVRVRCALTKGHWRLGQLIVVGYLNGGNCIVEEPGVTKIIR